MQDRLLSRHMGPEWRRERLGNGARLRRGNGSRIWQRAWVRLWIRDRRAMPTHHVVLMQRHSSGPTDLFGNQATTCVGAWYLGIQHPLRVPGTNRMNERSLA